MIIKTNELTGDTLDWAVDKCENPTRTGPLTDDERYSTNWAQGGPIIEREMIDILSLNHATGIYWRAEAVGGFKFATGSTPLLAAMRCFVASKLGDEVDVPDELGETKYA